MKPNDRITALREIDARVRGIVLRRDLADGTLPAPIDLERLATLRALEAGAAKLMGL